jgi:hypothetical protein
VIRNETSISSGCSALGLPGRLSAQAKPADSTQQAILGTWKLISYVRQGLPSGAQSDVMGAHPSGYVNFGADGRMIVVIAARDRKKPVGTVATPDEAEALLTSMIAYSGTYTIDSAAKKVSIHVDVSWEQSRVGTVQVRSYKLEGGHLLLTTEPSTDPATGEKTVRTLVWER